MKMRGAWFWALLFAAIHAALAIAYAGETPYRTPGRLISYGGQHVPDIGAPDERQHANYVQGLLDGNGFPVFHPGAPDTGEHYEDHQPPLFYLADAGFAKLVGVSDVDSAGAYKLRWLNCLIGAGTVLGVFALGLWGLGRADVALGGAALAAALPMNCALSGAISNDPLLFMLSTWTLAVCALSLKQGWSLRNGIVAGLLVGLAILTKTTALALLPVLLLAILIPQKKRPDVKTTVLAVLAMAVTCGPWLVRNQMLYGDPFALKAFNSAFTGSAQARTFIGQFGPAAYWRDWVGWWTARSFFGVFGYMDIWLNPAHSPYGSASEHPNLVYRLLLAISVCLFASGLLSLFKSDWKEARGSQVLNLVFLSLVVLLFLRFNMQYFQAQGRYLYPAIGPIALTISAGCFVLLREKGRVLVASVAVALLLVNVFALAKLPDEFQRRALAARIAGRGGMDRKIKSTQSQTC